MKQSIRITSRLNKRLYADAIPGHFATNHSHINYYLDMSEIKHSMAMSREAARSIAYQFSSTSIDTLLCMEGTEYIGAYLAGELSSVGMGNVNSGKDIYLVEPDSNVNGQFVFSDNQNFVRGKACPDCAAGTPLDAIVTPRGYNKL